MKLKAENINEAKSIRRNKNEIAIEGRKWKNAFTWTVIQSSKRKNLKLLNNRIASRIPRLLFIRIAQSHWASLHYFGLKRTKNHAILELFRHNWENLKHDKFCMVMVDFVLELFTHTHTHAGTHTHARREREIQIKTKRTHYIYVH